MSRLYTVQFAAVAITAVQDLFSFTPADDKPIRLWGFELSNVGGTADAGDAQEEILAVSVRRGATSVGSGGSAPTPVPLNPADTAAAFTARANDTVQAGTGTIVRAHSTGFNVRNPTPYMYVPELLIQAVQGGLLVLSLDTAPNDSISISGTAWVEEL